jgi:hypothetical protein
MLRSDYGAIDVCENLARLAQERVAGGGQTHMMRRPLQQANTVLAFEALELLTQGGLDDVFARDRTAKCSSSASVTKYRNCRSSTAAPHAVRQHPRQQASQHRPCTTSTRPVPQRRPSSADDRQC